MQCCVQAQVQAANGGGLPYPVAPQPALTGPTEGAAYPGLAEYMGMELSEAIIRENMPEYLPGNQVSTVPDNRLSV